MKKQLLLFAAILGCLTLRAGNFINTVTVKSVDDCDTAAIITVQGYLPASNSVIDSIVLTQSVELPGGVSMIGMTYRIYTSFEPGSIGLPVLIPFEEKIVLTHQEVREGGFFNSGINVAMYSNEEYLELESAQYYYQQKEGCQFTSPKSITHCDTITHSITNFYDICGGYRFKESSVEVIGNTAYITHIFDQPLNGPICLTILGSFYNTTEVEIPPLNPGAYEVVTELVINELDEEDNIVGTTSTRYVDDLEVLQGNCPITAFEEGIDKESLFYPSPVQTNLNLSEKVKSAKIYSLSGQLLSEQNTSNIDVNELPKGIYILEMALDNNLVREKFLKN